jgi:hypothetical protein
MVVINKKTSQRTYPIKIDFLLILFGNLENIGIF